MNIALKIGAKVGAESLWREKSDSSLVYLIADTDVIIPQHSRLLFPLPVDNGRASAEIRRKIGNIPCTRRSYAV